MSEWGTPHRHDCDCQDCENRRVWAYLMAGPEYWDEEGDREILGVEPRSERTAK